MKVFHILFLLQFPVSHFQQGIHLLLQLLPFEFQDPPCPSMSPWQVSVLSTELWSRHKAMGLSITKCLVLWLNFSYATNAALPNAFP